MAKSARSICEIALYWNEDVIFEARIRNTLAYANFFYVAEGNESHSGIIKRDEFQFPKLLQGLAARAPELDLSRVIFVPVDLSNAGASPVERERLVRDSALEKLKADQRLRAGDILLVQDFDEFFLPTSTPILLSYFSSWQAWRKVLRLKYRMTYYKLNLEEQSAPWDLVLAIRGSLALTKNFSPNFFRHSIRKRKFRTSREFLGWHHSYLGDSKKILEKIRSFAEAFIPLVKDISEDEILARVSRGEDLFGRDFSYQKIDYAKSGGIPALLAREDLLLK
jgi:hypothetical protein